MNAGPLGAVLMALLAVASLAQSAPPTYGSSSPPPAVYGSTPPPGVYGSTPPPLPPSPTPTPSPLPSSPSPSPQPSPSASPSVVTPTRAFAGVAHFLGPVSGCEGTSMDGYGTSALTTTTTAGAFSGTANPSALQVFVTLDTTVSATCVDTFTGLPLPFALFGVLNTASSSSSSSSSAAPVIPLTPVTRVLASSAAAMSAADPFGAAYAMVGVGGAFPAGTLAALSSASRVVRLTGIRMLYADAALASAVTSAIAALGAFPAGTLPACATADARAAAVYAALGSLISASGTGAVDLTAVGLVSNLVTSAAAGSSCKAAAATLAAANVVTLAQQADALHQVAVAALALTTPLPSGGGAELGSVMPLTALEAAARAVYVVQAKGAAAVAAVGAGNAAAVAQLISGFPAELAAAPVDAAAMATAIGALPAQPVPATLRLAARAAGPLTGCAANVRDLYLREAQTATTDDKGVATTSLPVSGVLVALPSGCRDAALSNSTHSSVSTHALSVLLPPGVDSAALNPAAALATALFLYKAGASDTFASRAIAPSDFAAVYNYFKLGLAGAADELPTGTDFVRQNFGNASASAAVLGARAYLLNLRLGAMAGPTSAFLSGLMGVQVDGVAAAMMAAFARDLAAGNLTLSSSSSSGTASTSDDATAYLTNTMMGVYQRQQHATGGSRRHMLQTTGGALTLDQLSALMSSAASVVAASTALLTQLDDQVQSAAAAGSPLDAAVVFHQAAQVASVQQTALTAALVQLAAAAASGNATEVAALSTKLSSDFTGAALHAAVQSAAVSQAALTDMLASSGIATGTTQQQAAAAPSSGSSSSHVAVIVGCTVGIVGGAVVIAGVAAVMVQRRRAAQRVAHKSDGGYDAAFAPTGVAAVGTVPPSPPGCVDVAADVEMGAAPRPQA